MGLFDFFGDDHPNRDAYNQIYQQDLLSQPEHKAKFSHELVGGGAAFFAMHEWEKKQAASGQPVNHAFAKELLAGIAGAEVDRLAETKGLDFLDREKAKHHARREAEQLYDQQYGGRQEGEQY